MLEQLLKMYVMAMATGVTSPMPHIVGPAGCGKSTTIYQLGELVERKVHTINLARISPLELEGVQMPVEGNTKLQLLHSTIWKQIEEGDIVLFDECLRAFPEVFDGLLDILTAREVGGYKLPRAFFVGASNSVTSYDKALEDRLLHITVPDVRRNNGADMAARQQIIDKLGLLPAMLKSSEMAQLMSSQVYPMYNLLDQFKGHGVRTGTALEEGRSVRNLIGQAQLRTVQCDELAELIEANNRLAVREGKYQYVLLLTGTNAPPKYLTRYADLPEEKLTPVQLTNLRLNKQLLEMEQMNEEGATHGDVDAELFD